MRDGCIEDEWRILLDNSATRSDPNVNEDWFNMTPFIEMGSCKSKWNINCKTASCKRGLER